MKSSKSGKTIGVFAKDSFPGEFCESWKTALKDQPFEKVDVGGSIAYVMAPKEESEILTIKKACIVSVDVFSKYLKDHIMEVIDADKVKLKFYKHYVLLTRFFFSFAESKARQISRRC